MCTDSLRKLEKEVNEVKTTFSASCEIVKKLQEENDRLEKILVSLKWLIGEKVLVNCRVYACLTYFFCVKCRGFLKSSRNLGNDYSLLSLQAYGTYLIVKIRNEAPLF